MIEDAGYTIRDDLVHGFVGGYLPPVLGSRSRALATVPEFTFEAGMMVVVQPNVVTATRRRGADRRAAARHRATAPNRCTHFERGLLAADAGRSKHDPGGETDERTDQDR